MAMATDLEFIDELTAFLELETLAGTRHRQADPSSDRESDDSIKGEPQQYSTRGRKSKRRDDTPDDRRQKYRQRVKNERDELRKTVDELSAQVQDLINAREGRNTTARTDLRLSKTFWRQVATQQRERRLEVEAEHKRLSTIVNAQGAYIGTMGVTYEKPTAPALTTDDFGYDKIDDLKWLRLKSSLSTLYSTYLQDVNKCYAQVDQVYRDAKMESLPIGILDETYSHNQTGDVGVFHYRSRWLQPFSFQVVGRAMWEVASLSHWQMDRQVYHGVSDAKNTVAMQFRLKKTLANGDEVSIMKSVVTRRFVGKDRVVIVWKVFSEGEGVFSGLDVDETAWSIIRPQSDRPQALMEAYSRQVPVPYLTENASNPVVKDFLEMMQEAVKEDEYQGNRLLGKLLVEDPPAVSCLGPTALRPVVR